MRKFLRFLKRHLAAIFVVILAIVAIVLLVTVIGGIKNGGSKVNGTPGIVVFDGSKIGVFDTADEAMANPITDVKAETKSFSVNDDNSRVTADYQGYRLDVPSSGGNYQVDLAGIPDQGIVVIKAEVGGDGSLFGQAVGVEVETHYFAVQVKNEGTNDVQASTTVIPNGTIWFGEDKYQTYSSEEEAQAAVAASPLVIPTEMAKNLVLKAEPANEKTARIYVKVCMVDDYGDPGMSVLLCEENGWTNTLDVSQYAGKQITLYLKAESGSAVVTSYSYVSFMVPANQS